MASKISHESKLNHALGFWSKTKGNIHLIIHLIFFYSFHFLIKDDQKIVIHKILQMYARDMLTTQMPN